MPSSQFVLVANVQYPHVYQVFLDGVKLFDFDLGWMLSASCLVHYDFHSRLLFTTVGPVVFIVLLGMTYKVTERRNRQSLARVRHVQHKHLSAVLLLTFFLYANVSSILFQTFSCEHLENGKFYLRADYLIECDSVMCGLEKLGLVDQNWLERNFSGFLLRTLVVGRRQHSESIEVALEWSKEV